MIDLVDYSGDDRDRWCDVLRCAIGSDPNNKPLYRYYFIMLLLLMINTFGVWYLQLNKLRRHNESAIDLSYDNPARRHKEVL